MSAATLSPSQALLPQPPGGLAPGAALALVVHAGLIAALTLGVDWRTQPDTVFAAELWAAVPEAAAPLPTPPPAPTPAPLVSPPPPAPVPAPAPPPAAAAPTPPPDIAIERERQRQTEQAETRRREQEARAERERQARTEQDARRKAQQEAARRAAEQRAAEERLAQQREDYLRRVLEQPSPSDTTSSTGGSGRAAQAAAPSAAYQGRVKAAILPNIVYTGQVDAQRVAEVEVTAAPGGTIIARRLIKPSGHADWDAAVLRAIDRTARLPVDTNGRVPPTLIISFRPGE